MHPIHWHCFFYIYWKIFELCQWIKDNNRASNEVNMQNAMAFPLCSFFWFHRKKLIFVQIVIWLDGKLLRVHVNVYVNDVSAWERKSLLQSSSAFKTLTVIVFQCLIWSIAVIFELFDWPEWGKVGFRHQLLRPWSSVALFPLVTRIVLDLGLQKPNWPVGLWRWLGWHSI